MRSGLDFQLQLVRMAALTPMLIVMGLGLVLAVWRLPRHPRASWLLIAAIALGAFNSVGLPVLLQVLLSRFNTFSTTDGLWLRTVLFTLPQAILGAVAWSLIFCAVFDRPTPPKFLDDEPIPKG